MFSLQWFIAHNIHLWYLVGSWKLAIALRFEGLPKVNIWQSKILLLATCLAVSICIAISKFSKPLIINSIVIVIQNNKLQLFVNSDAREDIYSFGFEGYMFLNLILHLKNLDSSWILIRLSLLNEPFWLLDLVTFYCHFQGFGYFL